VAWEHVHTASPDFPCPCPPHWPRSLPAAPHTSRRSLLLCPALCAPVRTPTCRTAAAQLPPLAARAAAPASGGDASVCAPWGGVERGRGAIWAAQRPRTAAACGKQPQGQRRRVRRLATLEQHRQGAQPISRGIGGATPSAPTPRLPPSHTTVRTLQLFKASSTRGLCVRAPTLPITTCRHGCALS